MALIEGKTTANPYVDNVAGGNQYNITPLLTVGDEVPLLEGNFGEFTTSETQTYAMAGIPDGLGYTEIGDLKYVWMNHELGADVTTDTTGGVINGARVSLYVFDENWNAIGAKNLIETVEADGTTYQLELGTGNYVDADGNIFNDLLYDDVEGAIAGFSRFCSGYLAASGFVDENGDSIPVYFAPEESGNPSRGWAVTPEGNALAIEGLGRYSKEQVYAASQDRADNSDRTVLLSMEDTGDGEIYMYVGDQTDADPNGFRDTEDSLYVLRVEDADGKIFSYEDLPENEDLVGRWVPVPDEFALDATGDELEAFVNGQEDNGDVRSTNFRRPEDIHEDPNSPGTFYLVTTGQTEINGSLEEEATNPSQADNPYGKLHRFTLNPDDPTGEMNFEFLMSGGPDKGVSFDNMVVDRNGNVVIQEDVTGFGGDVMAAENRDGRVLSYNIEENEGVVGDDKVEFLVEINESVEGEQFEQGVGEWESSGIVEIDPNAQPNESSYLFDVQAHTILNESGVYEGQYQEGGQLLLIEPRTAEEPTEPTEPEGTLGTGEDERINGTNGRDLIKGLGGNDTLVGGNDPDRLIGGFGNDSLYGQNGNDTLEGRLGNDRFFGGQGNDVLRGGSGRDWMNGGAGNDTMVGGASRDRFIFNTNEEYNRGDLGVDTIEDFDTELDTILLDTRTFTALEDIAADFGTVTSDNAVAGSDAIIVYNTSNGNLFYNANGTSGGFGGGGQFATLTDAPDISAESFIVRG